MDLNDCKDDAFCINIGRLFHRRGAATCHVLATDAWLNKYVIKLVEQYLNVQFETSSDIIINLEFEI